jgi:hypothetical protein
VLGRSRLKPFDAGVFADVEQHDSPLATPDATTHRPRQVRCFPRPGRAQRHRNGADSLPAKAVDDSGRAGITKSYHASDWPGQRERMAERRKELPCYEPCSVRSW